MTVKQADPDFGKICTYCPDITFNGKTVTGVLREETDSQNKKIKKCRYAVTCYQCGDPCVQKNALSTAITLNNKFCSDFTGGGSLPLVESCDECSIDDIGRCYDMYSGQCFQGVTSGACYNLLNIHQGLPGDYWSKYKVTIQNNSVTITGNDPCPPTTSPPVKGSCCINDGSCFNNETFQECQQRQIPSNRVYFSPESSCPPQGTTCFIPPDPVSYCYDLDENKNPVCVSYQDKGSVPEGGIDSTEPCTNGTNSSCPTNSACYYYDSEISSDNTYTYINCDDSGMTRAQCMSGQPNNVYIYGSNCDNINHPRKTTPPPTVTRWYCATSSNNINPTNSCQSVTGDPNTLPPGYDSESECRARCRNPNGSVIN